MSRIITHSLLTSSLSIFSLRRRPTLSLPTIDSMTRFCLFSSLSSVDHLPRVHANQIVFPSPNSDSNSRLECDWTPPLRVSCITKDKYTLSCCGRHWTRGGRHWLVIMHLLGTEVDTEQELFNYYIKLLAWYLGSSEEEAKKKIYLVSYGCCYGFGAEFDYETRQNIRDYLGVSDVVEDLYYYARRRDPNVESAAPFVPRNLNFRLNNLFSYHHLSEPNSNWNSDHWLINVNQPDDGEIIKQPDYEEIIDFFIKMLAEVVGSEKAAIEKIYIIWRKLPFGFGAEIDEDAVEKLRGMVGVLKVLPDYAFDVKETRHTYGLGMSDYSGDFVTWKRRALQITPSTLGLRYSSYHFAEECTLEASHVSMAERFGGSGDSSCFQAVQSACGFPRINQNHIFTDIFSYHHLSERKSEWKFDHWLIHIKQQNDPSITEQQTIDFCFRMLADVVGSEKDARSKIYVVWCKMPFGFGAEIDEETSIKLKALPDVLAVLPDYAFDVENRNHGVLVISPLSFLRFRYRRTIYYWPLIYEELQYEDEDGDATEHYECREPCPPEEEVFFKDYVEVFAKDSLKRLN